MRYKDKNLNLSNYTKHLSGFSVDIMDEVRSAIMDSVEIGGFIESCRDNPFRLQQIRLGMKEGISSEIFRLEGETIYSLRKKIQLGVLSESIIEVINSGASDSAVLIASELDSQGYSILGYDFSIIPNSIVDLFGVGIRNGLPMNLLNNGKFYSRKFVESFLSIAQGLGKSKESEERLRIIVKQGWSDDLVNELADSARFVGLPKIIDVLGPETPSAYVEAYRAIMESGLNISDFALVDDNGCELYSTFQLNFIARSALQGYDVTDMKDYTLSSTDLEVIKSKAVVDKQRTLRGVLGSERT